MAQDKPREITVRAKDDGPAGRKSAGLHARDSQTGAYIWIPSPILPEGAGGRTLEGREADAYVAGKLLTEGKRLTWERDTAEASVYMVWDA